MTSGALLVINVLVAVACWGVVSVLARHLKMDQAVASLLTAIVAVLGSAASGAIAEHAADPSVSVKVERPATDHLTFRISKARRFVDRIDITCQIYGIVTNIRSLDSNVHLGGVEKYVVGHQSPMSVNQVRLAVHDIDADTTAFSFDVFYDPTSAPGLQVADGDRFNFRYLWKYNGNTRQGGGWRLLDSNEDVPPPFPGETLGFRALSREMTEPEVAYQWKQSLPMTTFPDARSTLLTRFR